MEKRRVLIVTQEMNPYLDLSDIASTISELPKFLQDQGMEIRILMPRFGNINERRHRLHEVVRLSGINISVNDEDYPLIIKVASLPGARLQVYFLDNEEFFKRKSVFTDKEDKFFEDNDERMIFFCKGVLETVKKFGWAPDIIHCHGWMTSLIPMYLKTAFSDEPVFSNAKVVYSLYGDKFPGKLGENFIEKDELATSVSDEETDFFRSGEYSGLNKGASAYADALIFGSDAVDQNLSDFIQNRNGKPILNYSENEDFLEEQHQFYQSLLD